MQNLRKRLHIWRFGNLATIAFLIQIISGIALMFYYSPHGATAFASVQAMMTDPAAALFRNIHRVGSSFFFILVYAHMIKGVYYGTYKSPHRPAWFLGVFTLILLIAIGMTGYVLPWGQLSYWGATVATHMLATIPVIGEPLAMLTWGGYGMSDASVIRFFIIHITLPIVLLAGIIFHIRIARKNKKQHERSQWRSLLTTRRIIGLGWYLVPFVGVVFLAPELFSNSGNNIPANPLETPASIMPEWFLLPFFALVKLIPHQTAGMLAAAGVPALLVLLPWIDKSAKPISARPRLRVVFWLAIFTLIVLGYAGSQPIYH